MSWLGGSNEPESRRSWHCGGKVGQFVRALTVRAISVSVGIVLSFLFFEGGLRALWEPGNPPGMTRKHPTRGYQLRPGPTGMVETLYRGGKGDFLEGGVRVPAFARWPGVIEEKQIVGDIIHETDLFTTFANLADAKEYIPTDRIIDGIDQTSLLLNGDGNSRRDYVFIYTGDELAATVKGRYKRDWRNATPGLSGAEFYDLYNDPREANALMLPLFPTKPMFSIMKTRHLMMKAAYPDKRQARDFPFKNVVNARPETINASKPRLDPSKLPFDPREAIMQVPEWDNLDRRWGAP